MLLARFFKVHPGYLVDDPEGYHTELTSDLRAMQDRLDLWLINGAEEFAADPELSRALLLIAKHPDTRKCLVLLGAILEAPELVDRLSEVLKPAGVLHRDGGTKRASGVNHERGNVLSHLLPGGSNSQCPCVPRREPASAACAFPPVAWPRAQFPV